MEKASELVEILGVVFSAVVLTGVGVIISGKLLANRMPMNLGGEDLFRINLIILRLQAKGDEVVWGFLMFICAMVGIVVSYGGRSAYEFFEESTALHLGQWSSLCAMASFLSIILSALAWALAPLFRGIPLLSDREREQQLRKLSDKRQQES